MLAIKGTSDEEQGILTISKAIVDVCEDAEGNSTPAVVVDQRWRQMPEGLPESAYSSAGLNAGDLQLALILRSAVKDVIGHIEGTFEVQAGEMRPVIGPFL